MVRSTGTIGVDREPGVVTGNREVARGNELATGRGGHPVHLGDGRLRDRVQPGHEVDAGAEQLLVELGLAGCDDLTQVVPGGKGRSPSFDHEHRRVSVGHGVERGEHLAHERERQSVAPIRSVERQPGERVADVELDVLERH
jgi:hypothetical protein